VLRPEFYNLLPLNRDAELKILGLNAKSPTLLLFFGGNGSKVMKSILKKLNGLGCLMQVICLCGHNMHLKAELEVLEIDYPLATIGYSERVSYYMQIADIFIGKPGNISVAEAVHMGLPVITVQNSKTLIQERYTGEWVKDHDYGVVLDCWQDIRNAVSRLTKPGELDRFRQSMKGNQNYGLYEATNFILELADDKHPSG
jgi:1,2-diacylglycerol 3-beta-galactosyltransferase